MAKEICKEDVNELELRIQNSFQFDAFIAYAYEDTERSTVKAANKKFISFMSFENITFINRAFQV